MRLESSLALARADLRSAELALERTRVRAPADGTVLNVLARVGETAVPSPDSAVVVFGDLSSLRLRAEVEERDAAKVHVGQRVVVKADAFPDKTFEGSVTSISQSLGAPRIATRGPRRPNDVEVVEVMVALDGHPPLFTGMRVDTFFKLDDQASTASAGSDEDKLGREAFSSATLKYRRAPAIMSGALFVCAPQTKRRHANATSGGGTRGGRIDVCRELRIDIKCLSEGSQKLLFGRRIDRNGNARGRINLHGFLRRRDGTS